MGDGNKEYKVNKVEWMESKGYKKNKVGVVNRVIREIRRMWWKGRSRRRRNIKKIRLVLQNKR